MSEEASSQQQTQSATSTVGGAESVAPQAAVSSLMPDNPPAYSAVAKEHEAQLNQPIGTGTPVAYMPAVAPGGGVPPVQYVIAAPMQSSIPKAGYPGPHDFVMLIVFTVIICAILNITSLFFGIAALAVALMAKDAKQTQRNYLKASRYSNIAVGLAIATIVYTLVITFLVVVLPIVYRGSGYNYVLGCRSLDYQEYNGKFRCNYYG